MNPTRFPPYALSHPINRLGARLGNWNDRRFGKELSRAERPRVWRVLDQIASNLYTLGPDRAGRS